MPGLRIIRRLAFALAIPVALFLAANVVLERVAEARIADAARSTFGLSERPDVDVSGFPIVVNLLRGKLPGLSVDAQGARVEGLTLRSLSVRLRSIEADGGFLGGGGLGLRIGAGEVRAEADDAAMNAFLKRRKQRATIHLRPDGATVRARRRILGRERLVVARGAITFSKGVLRFRPGTVTVDGERPPPGIEAEAKRQSSIDVKLPKLPGGIAPTAFVPDDGFLRIEAALKGYRLDLGG